MLANGDQIYCKMTSNAACISPATATSPTTTVTVLPLPNVQITPSGPLSFCQGNSVTLTANPNGAYLWSTGETTKSITVFTSGDYTVAVTTANTCSGVSTATKITVNPLPPMPTIFPPGPIILCEGEDVMLTSSFTGAKKLAATAAWLADPPSSLGLLALGVLMESRAVVPTTRTLMDDFGKRRGSGPVRGRRARYGQPAGGGKREVREAGNSPVQSR